MSKQQQKCFVGYSHDAEWRDDVLGACDEVLPKFGLEPWNAAAYFSTESLRDTVTQMIDTAQCGIYDLSYWHKRNTNDWVMPRNVFIELGIAIALNRPYLLLQHDESKQHGPPLPDCLESIKDQIITFTGKYTLKQALQAHLPQWNTKPEGHDWQSNYCYFGNRACAYREKHPVHKWPQDKLLCLVSDGQDADRPDFRAVVEEITNAYDAIELRYMDTLSVTEGYSFLFCTYCQSARSTPLALYRITTATPAETFISIGMSVALEKQFSCNIPKLLLTSSLKNIPSLLAGYKVVVVSNSTDLKKQLQEYLPQAIQYIRKTSYKPKPLPFKESKPSVTIRPNKIIISTQPKPAILIADDSISIRQSLRYIFSKRNYTIYEASDGMEALERLTKHIPDVLLLDMEMPNLNGYDLLNIIRLYPELTDVKVVILTSRSSAKHRQRALSMGAHAYLTKPCPQDTLLVTIEHLLEH